MAKNPLDKPSLSDAPRDVIRASEARPLDAARDAAGELGAPFPSAPRETDGGFAAAREAAEQELSAQRAREQERRDLERQREERERFEPVARMANALQISALLDLHRLTSHAGAGDGRYLRAATKLGDELVGAVERAFEG